MEAAAAGGGGAKRQKTEKKEKAAPPSSLPEWMDAHLAGRLSSLTNPLLKDFCKTHGLAVSGKKDDLLARIHDYLEEEIERQAAAEAGGAKAGGGEAGGGEASGA